VQAVPTGSPSQVVSAVELPGHSRPRQLRRWIGLAARLRPRQLEAGRKDAEEVDPELRRRRVTISTAVTSDAALAAYQAILDANPTHAEAKGAGAPDRVPADVRLAQRPDALAAADAATDDIDAALAAADLEILQQDVIGRSSG